MFKLIARYLTLYLMMFSLLLCGYFDKSPPPNIIYILADDLGYGDVSFQGQQKFKTPNIDRLASQGMVFTQHYSGSTVCAPSRSTLLTGMHTGHTYIRGNKRVETKGQYPLLADTYTLSKMVKEHGYTTGIFGKWGLGYPGSEGAPENQGFDEFYGYNSQTLAHNYYPYHLWHNEHKIILEGNKGKEKGEYAADLIHNQALEFIDKNKARPFFMYYATQLPHAELLLPDEYMTPFKGKLLPETPYQGVDDGQKYKVGGYGSQEEPHAAFAAMVTLLDRHVGELMTKLAEKGIADNTLIIFTSDNGPHVEGGAEPLYFKSSGPFKGIKRDLYEGGIRVPMIASWPRKIEAGSVTDHISAFWDVLPTVAELIDVSIEYQIDGISFLPTLLQKGKQQDHEYLYWEFHEEGGRIAIRKGNWKGVKYNVWKFPDRKMELYDLSNDSGEAHNLAEKYPEVVAQLESHLADARTESEVFLFPPPTFTGVD